MSFECLKNTQVHCYIYLVVIVRGIITRTVTTIYKLIATPAVISLLLFALPPPFPERVVERVKGLGRTQINGIALNIFTSAFCYGKCINKRQHGN